MPRRETSRHQIPQSFRYLHTLNRHPIRHEKYSTKHKTNHRIEYAYDPDDGIEHFAGYCAGGYLPVKIGDEFCSSRYRVVHKLGHGGYSTVWLAYDNRTSRHVAIKIARSEVESPHETKILRMLKGKIESGESRPGSEFLPHLLDAFEVLGPEIAGSRGVHQCTVTAPARMSVSEARDCGKYGLFQPQVARAMVAQLVQAMVYLHSIGVVHADLHEGNILLQFPSSFDDLTTKQIYETYGEPKLIPATRLDGQPLDEWVPRVGVVPIFLGTDSEKVRLEDARILLSDFGESFLPEDDPRFESHIPHIMRPPEMFLDPRSRMSFPADIWALGCTIFALLGRSTLIDRWCWSDDEIIAEQLDVIGTFPAEWRLRWSKRHKYYNRAGEPHERPRTLADRVEDSIQEPRREASMEAMGDDERCALIGLLQAMLSARPKHRITAQQVLESNWVIRWAEPALRLMQRTRAVN
ncbi:SRSF protein kinase 2 [Fulvia fulva]|uniref:SRSF protein kinase 2 n=1 Tax=Passalora fulva TaxID=5499 RepID=A0A9Q8PFU9_PASFU|nr:SRSF protein kinase 2 [Fulvia fulva]KAK4613571.1 SRSF protein kinase 2 [Fulvia fulva]KAK4614868.1 SRSF protein kinase 2 [Fulvia fulva]UJO21723.1 SRSF protein kinase 2 [Fulvia fulva]WPV20574.1 SRSF protein kinase 2 [Fulvia fulva]WPV35534.1 SRSF protein kinase 2 [Fulvia fulva]